MPQTLKLNLGQIAGQAQVPIASVWKVIFGQGKTINSEEFTRIWTVLEQLNAVELTANTTPWTTSIGMVLPNTGQDLLNDITGVILQGVVEAIDTHHYTPVLHFPQMESAPDWGEFLKRIGGAIMICSYDTRPILEKCLEMQRPYVLVETDYRYESPLGAIIAIDNHQGMQLIMQHLLGLGHRRIGIVTGLSQNQSSRERLEGYQEALRQAGIPIENELITEGEWNEVSGYEGGQRLLRLNPPPTAIAAANDMMAVGVMRAAAQAGLTVGKDLSVTGFDDIPSAASIAPGLTTVRQPLKRMGALALACFHQLFQGQPLATHQIQLPAELVVRQSTGAVKKE
ncbi:MAG TPA: substrate-binding domain-containing protein [Phototrophicaceae bacterium]|nr:substrate-binding domain-containing protein [Phototrophicaceae bacterium]